MTSLDFERFFGSLLGPLRFACKNQCQNLQRLHQLETGLKRESQRLKAQYVDQPLLIQQLTHFETLLPSESDPISVRQQALSLALQCLQTTPTLKTEQLAAKPTTPPVVCSNNVAIAPVKHLTLDHAIQYVRGVGPHIATLMQAKHIDTVYDLLMFLPRRYCAREATHSLADIAAGMMVTVEAPVLASAQYSSMQGRRSLSVMIGTLEGRLQLLWFRVPYAAFADKLKPPARVRVSGLVRKFRHQLQMVHPEISFINNDDVSHEPEDSILPMYSDLEGLKPALVRKIMANALEAVSDFEDPIPNVLMQKRNLVSREEALRFLHQPPSSANVEELDNFKNHYHARLIYEELLIFQLHLLQKRSEFIQEKGVYISKENMTDLEACRQFILPFKLTNAQARTLLSIQHDLASGHPMHRLVQGDVGAGKTAVAFVAMHAVVREGYQCLMMAPTELLAEQHAKSAKKILEPAGVRVALLTSSVGAREKKELLEKIKQGRVDVVIGTHALIQEAVVFCKLALAIIDEQHRFGVLQRARVLKMGKDATGKQPHLLLMTATPIPRTLALTAYGDLHVSIIDELPPGRTPIKTMLYNGKARQKVYEKVMFDIEQGRQAYVVFPLVEESDKEGMERLHDATSSAEELAQGMLKHARVGLLHGKMHAQEKDAMMRAFAAHELDVLVSTTVIEVGIDVPNATVMVIEHAERFGLSQLHQLRGRVGRGQHASSCLLVAYSTSSEDAWRRLSMMEQTQDGFAIAEEDLNIRGPGDLVGTRQSGMPELMLANLARDQQLLALAREDAEALIACDAHLLEPQHALLRQVLQRRWHKKLSMAQVG